MYFVEIGMEEDHVHSPGQSIPTLAAVNASYSGISAGRVYYTYAYEKAVKSTFQVQVVCTKYIVTRNINNDLHYQY